jgi:hypothetical protein
MWTTFRHSTPVLNPASGKRKRNLFRDNFKAALMLPRTHMRGHEPCKRA